MSFNLGEFGIAYLIFLFSTTLHEYGHARVGLLLGSRFAEDEGLVTLDPTPHIKRSVFGMVVFPIITFLQWGWPMGWASVPYDPRWADRNPRGQALMSLAGPAGNLLLAVVAFVALRVCLNSGVLSLSPDQVQERSLYGALAYGLPMMLTMNLALGIFNLFPIPPLDGAGVIQGFFPKASAKIYAPLQSSPFVAILLFLIVFNFGWQIIGPIVGLVFSLL